MHREFAGNKADTADVNFYVRRTRLRIYKDLIYASLQKRPSCSYLFGNIFCLSNTVLEAISSFLTLVRHAVVYYLQALAKPGAIGVTLCPISETPAALNAEHLDKIPPKNNLAYIYCMPGYYIHSFPGLYIAANSSS